MSDMAAIPVVPPLNLTPPAALPSSWTLLLPSVSIGNVPQLAVDLLLTTLPSACHHGHLRTNSTLPFVSPAPPHPPHTTSLITAVELYTVLERPCAPPVLAIQQRAPAGPGLAASHARSLIEWALASGCVEVVLLVSANAAGLRGKQLRAALHAEDPLRGLRVVRTTPAMGNGTLGERAVGALGWSVLENAGGDARGWEESCPTNVELEAMSGTDDVPAFLPSQRKGGFVRTALELCEEREVSLTGLVQFVHEGDNVRDAMLMATAAAMLVGGMEEDSKGVASVPAWKVPSSWADVGLPPQGLY